MLRTSIFALGQRRCLSTTCRLFGPQQPKSGGNLRRIGGLLAVAGLVGSGFYVSQQKPLTDGTQNLLPWGDLQLMFFIVDTEKNVLVLDPVKGGVVAKSELGDKPKTAFDPRSTTVIFVLGYFISYRFIGQFNRYLVDLELEKERNAKIL